MKIVKKIDFEADTMKKVFAVVVIAIIVGIVLYQRDSLSIGGSYDIGDEANCLYNYKMYGIDENGNIVEIPIYEAYESAFDVNGVEAVQVFSGVTWTASGSNVLWSTFQVTAELTVKYVSGYHDSLPLFDSGEVFPIPDFSTQYVHTSPAQTTVQGQWGVDMILGQDIANSIDTQIDGAMVKWSDIGVAQTGVGWLYRFEMRLISSVQGPLGETYTDNKYLGAFLIWIGYDVSYTLNGEKIVTSSN